jgi:hypothetical protein
MNQQSDPPNSPMSIVQGQHLADQMRILIQKIEGLEMELTRLNSEPTAEEGGDPIQQITDLLSQLVQDGLRHERLLWEIRQELDSVSER